MFLSNQFLFIIFNITMRRYGKIIFSECKSYGNKLEFKFELECYAVAPPRSAASCMHLILRVMLCNRFG